MLNSIIYILLTLSSFACKKDAAKTETTTTTSGSTTNIATYSQSSGTVILTGQTYISSTATCQQ
jgi:hypothetical protein